MKFSGHFFRRWFFFSATGFFRWLLHFTRSYTDSPPWSSSCLCRALTTTRWWVSNSNNACSSTSFWCHECIYFEYSNTCNDGGNRCRHTFSYWGSWGKSTLQPQSTILNRLMFVCCICLINWWARNCYRSYSCCKSWFYDAGTNSLVIPQTLIMSSYPYCN